MQDDEPSYAKQQGLQPIARLSDEQIAKMYDDPDVFQAHAVRNQNQSHNQKQKMVANNQP